MKRLYLIVGALLFVSIVGAAQAGQKVLLIFSYHPEYSWVIEETRGVEDVFKDKGITTEKFYLDTKRNTTTEWKEKVAEDAVKKIEEFNPDLVMVFDDNACELVAKKYINKTLPLVFCGMNGEPENYGFPAENITGVVERHHLRESMELLKRLVPDAKKCVLLSDNSPTSQKFVAQIKKTTLPIDIYAVYTTNDFDTWKAKLRDVQSTVDVLGLYLYHTIKEKGGKVSMSSEAVLGWTLQNSQIPEFTFSDFTVRDGALCGVVVSGYVQGKAAAKMALTILAGASPANIPIRCPQEGIPMINERRAEELNIRIPEDVLKEVEIVE